MTYTGVVFSLKSENSAYTGVDFSLKSGFTKIMPTPVFPLLGSGKISFKLIYNPLSSFQTVMMSE